MLSTIYIPARYRVNSRRHSQRFAPRPLTARERFVSRLRVGKKTSKFCCFVMNGSCCRLDHLVAIR